MTDHSSPENAEAIPLTDKVRRNWPDPTPEMLNSNPLFEAIWQAIKTWDVNVPGAYGGYCGATGNHARAIYDSITRNGIRAQQMPSPANAELLELARQLDLLASNMNVGKGVEVWVASSDHHLVRAAADALRGKDITNPVALDWAVSRWNAEVKNRPLQNIHRRSLDDTWRQVIRYHGGDDKRLCGPSHDELLSSVRQ